MANARHDTASVSVAETATLFQPLEGFSHIAVGVSGGCDSLALAALLAEWAGFSAPPAGRQEPLPLRVQRKLTILSVDHGLRREAKQECAHVAQLCGKWNLPHEILRAGGAGPIQLAGGGNLQAKARDLRLKLLYQGAKNHGCEALILAHHRDDQVETVFLRLFRGTGIYGLGGMRPLVHYYDLPIYRPFLKLSKERLRASLRARHISWCEDPSNQNEQFARVKLRGLMPELKQAGLDPDRMARSAQRFQNLSAALDIWVTSLCRDYCQWHPAGPVMFSLAALNSLPAEIITRLLARITRSAAGAAYVPRFSQIERIEKNLYQSSDFKMTLAGIIVERKGERLWFYREHGRNPPPIIDLREKIDLRENKFLHQSVIWDNRYIVDWRGSADLSKLQCAVKRIGPAGALSPLSIKDHDSIWPTAAFKAAPCLEFADQSAYIPGIGCPPLGDQIILRQIGAFETDQIPIV